MTTRPAAPPTLLRLFPARVLARATGANLRTAERWRGGQSPQPRFLDRMYELQAVLDLLGREMTDAGKRAWLEAPSPALNWRRPIDELAAGRFDGVRGAAESYQAGDHA
jgi:uncharacterized protein (DUF2384 family)